MFSKNEDFKFFCLSSYFHFVIYLIETFLQFLLFLLNVVRDLISEFFDFYLCTLTLASSSAKAVWSIYWFNTITTKITEAYKFQIVKIKKIFPRSIDWKPGLSAGQSDFKKNYKAINRKVWLKKFQKNSCKMPMLIDKLGLVRIWHLWIILLIIIVSF